MNVPVRRPEPSTPLSPLTATSAAISHARAALERERERRKTIMTVLLEDLAGADLTDDRCQVRPSRLSTAAEERFLVLGLVEHNLAALDDVESACARLAAGPPIDLPTGAG